MEIKPVKIKILYYISIWSSKYRNNGKRAVEELVIYEEMLKVLWSTNIYLVKMLIISLMRLFQQYKCSGKVRKWKKF